MEQSRTQDDEAEDGADGAERAFEALRAEVAAQRRALERMATVLAAPDRHQAGEAPDYSPTLGAIAQELRAVGARLDGIEAQPALRVTPASQAAELRGQLHHIGQDARQGLADAKGRMDDAVQEMRRLIGTAHSRRAQERREWVAVAVGALLGLMLWYPLVFLTPWGGGHWLAATLIGGGRWGAGETLLQEADPASWERMVRLYRACPQDRATGLCEAVLAVRTIPTTGAKGARTPAFGMLQGQPRGKTGLER